MAIKIKTLDQEIIEMFKKRGYEVTSIQFCAMTWTIKAKVTQNKRENKCQ